MYIVIAGGGMVGGQLARKLMENKHDVVLIDPHVEVCNKIYSETGVIAVHGSASHIEVLKEAGVGKADIVVAATASDADNLACAILSKSLGVPRIIVRMRNPDYEKAYTVAGVNTVVRVTDLMVNQMIMEVENPKVRRITTIGGGRADIFKVAIPERAKVAGKSIKDITSNKQFPEQCNFVAIYNQAKEEFSIPRGQKTVNESDELFLVSPADKIKTAVDFLTDTKAP